MKQKWIEMYIDFALRAAAESHAVRLKVGAFFVSPDGVMSMGINGMPEGGTNECETKVYNNGTPDTHYIDEIGPYTLVTKDECSHAEENLFAKLMNAGVSTKGGMLFMTHSPCPICAKIIRGAGIKHVYYVDDYRKNTGITYLRKHDIIVEQIRR